VSAMEDPERTDEPGPPPEPSTPAPETETTAELPVEGDVAPSPAAEGEAAPAPKPKREPRKPKKKYTYGLKLFERWDLSESTFVVKDEGLKRYINLSPIVIPHTGGRHANRPFAKMRVSIVERLINGMMRSATYTGKKAKAIRAVRRAFEIIEERTKKHPVQVLLDALQKAAPREEITRLRFGGISVPRAVDVAPSRRLDMALRNICQGATAASFKSPKPIEECLADEILRASRGEMESAAIARKEELERISGSAR